MAAQSADPNFPPNLNIHPLQSLGESSDDNQEASIAKFGIAGRVWEATRPLIRYFSPDQQHGIEPPCPIFNLKAPRKILELGSGQAFASLHLADALQPSDLIVLSDLDNVVPLCETSIENWKQRNGESGATVVARPLAWGGDAGSVRAQGPFDFILMCDLIYFPHLYPPLLYTLLELTEPNDRPEVNEETFGPTIILSYHSRTLALEESFFDSFGKYFKMEPVIGGDWEAKVYICRRWRVTEEWSLPEITKVMEGAPGIVRGRDFGLIDELFASLEW